MTLARSSILLLGTGGHAVSCIDVIEQEGSFAIGGLIGLPGEVGKDVLAYPVCGVDDDLEALRKQHANALVVIGQIKTPEPRVRTFKLLKALDYNTPVIVSPRAYVSRHAQIGAGSIVMHGAVVNAGAVVGENCIINSRALIEHDAVVGDHCHVSTAAVVNGGARVERETFIGSGSIVREGVVIGPGCVIGMGQQIFRDCESGTRVPVPGRTS